MGYNRLLTDILYLYLSLYLLRYIFFFISFTKTYKISLTVNNW